MPNWLTKLTLLEGRVLNSLKRLALFEVCKFRINYSRLHPRNLKKLSLKKMAKGLVIFLILSAVIITIKDEIMYEFKLGPFAEEEYSSDELVVDEVQGEEKTCNVKGIELRGDVVTYISPSSLDEDGNQANDETASEEVVQKINEAEADDTIKAIILEVDSTGGSPVAAEEMANALKSATKPTVALVRNGATSAAYWASTGANVIFASSMSDIGSIGVTMSYLDETKKNNIEGLTYVSLIAGKFKDYGSSNKPLTEEERILLTRDLVIIHDVFIKAVADNRGLDINKVRALADGSSMPGKMALENGLIDEIGGMSEVITYLEDKIGEEVGVCW